MDKAKTLESSCDPLRVCKSYLKENRDWKIIKKSKQLEKRKEEERMEQKRRAEEKKSEFQEKEIVRNIQIKITYSLNRLPKRRENFSRNRR